MAVAAQDVTGRWAIYNGDCMDVMAAIPDGRVGLSVYSPPFAGLYQYSSSERDLSNNVNLAAFMEHYGHSHWIWRQYASAFWDDIRLDRVLPFREARDEEDEKHVHPLQLDVIDRAVVLWSNPGDRVLTPFMGVGSEVYGAVSAGRFGVGAELKPSYYRQAVRNLRSIDQGAEQMELDVPVEPQVVAQ